MPHRNALPQGLSRGQALPDQKYLCTAGLLSEIQPKAKGALNMAALANGKVSKRPNKHPKNPKKMKNPRQQGK